MSYPTPHYNVAVCISDAKAGMRGGIGSSGLNIVSSIVPVITNPMSMSMTMKTVNTI